MSEAAPDIPWWSPEQLLPPVGRLVRVRWGRGRAPFEAARAAHPESGELLWLTRHKGRPVWLPVTNMRPADPARAWVGFHTLTGRHPDLWGPIDVTQWPEPLPPPAYVEPAPDNPRAIQPRMWSARMRFAAVEEAEAADLARDMEEDRRVAAGSGSCSGASDSRSGSRPEAPEPQWWLDPHAVTYSPPGKISRREAEGRVMRAIATEALMRLERPRCNTFAAVLARLGKTLPGSADDPPPFVLSAFAPTGRDQDDMAVVAGWFLAIGCLPTVLERRAECPPLSWRRIAQEIGRSHEKARQLYAHLHDELHAAANGLATPGLVRARQRLEAVRDGNRAFKRAPPDQRRETAAGEAVTPLAEMPLTGGRLSLDQRQWLRKYLVSWQRIRQRKREDDAAARKPKKRKGTAA